MSILHFKEYGKGNILIILHGFLGTLDNWHTLSTRFGNWFKVYNLDQRNHGLSFHAHTHTIAEMSNDLLNFIQHHQLDKINIIGHSMGGKVAMHFALHHSTLVDKLVVVDIAPREYAPGHDDVFKAIFAVNLSLIKTRKEAEEMMLPYVSDVGVRQFLLKNLDRNTDGSFKWKMNLDVLYNEYHEVLKSIESNNTFTNDVLFIKGSNSKYIQDKDINSINTLFPKARVQTIQNAGHWVHAEQPDAFFELVLQFLKN